MEPTVVREAGCFWLIITFIIFLSFSARSQPLGVENDMLDIPDGYHLYKQDTVKAIMIISSDEWTDNDEYFGFPELMCGYVVKNSYRFRGNGVFYARKNRIKLSKVIYLDHNKIELKNVIVWSYSENVSYAPE